MEKEYLEWLNKCIKVCMKIDSLDNEQKKLEFDYLDKTYAQLVELQKQKIRDFLLFELSVDDYVYIASIIIAYSKNKELKEMFLEYFLKMKYDCFQGAMIEIQILAKGNINNYLFMRELHRKNVNLFKKSIDFKYEYIPISEREKNRIVIITDTLISKYNAPTMIVLQYAYVLKKMLGYKVDICACPMNKKIEYNWYKPLYTNSPREKITPNKHFNIICEDISLDVYQFNMDIHGDREYKSLLRFIKTWRPLFVFELGVSNPIADVTRFITTTVAMDVSIHLPISDADYLIKLADQPDEEKYITNYQKILSRGATQKYFETSGRIYDRIEFGFKNDDFLVAIVGNRLDMEIDKSFIEVLKKIQDDNENIMYLVIGECNILKDKFEQFGITHVCFMGERYDLMETYSIIDLYVNPERSGGGYSGLMAATAGVPVVTMPNCDVAYNVGDDFVVNNYNEMIETVNKCIKDKDFYVKKKEMTKKISEKNTKENMYQSICRELKKVINQIEMDLYNKHHFTTL